MTIIRRATRNARTRIFGARQEPSDNHCDSHGYYPWYLTKCQKCK